MSKYIKYFKTTAEYNAFLAADHATPYTAYVEEEDKYYYGAKEPEMMEFEFPQNPSGAFHCIKSVKNVVIPSGVTSISNSCFEGCGGLTSIAIPNTVTAFGDYSFRYAALTSINIPDSVTSIGQNAFQQCTSLTNVTIGTGITVISNTVFFMCTSLASVTVLATTPPTLGGNAFGQNASGRKIYVPAESVEAYKAASGWSTYASDIEAIPA